jgi:hypothetical protein
MRKYRPAGQSRAIVRVKSRSRALKVNASRPMKVEMTGSCVNDTSPKRLLGYRRRSRTVMAPRSSAQAASQPVGSWRFHAVRMVRQRSAGGCTGCPESSSTSTRARGSARCTRSMLRAAPKPPALSPASHTRRARGKVAATRRRIRSRLRAPTW